MSYTIAFAPARKPYQVGFLFTHEFRAISVTERRCAALISKVESHISDRCSHYTRSLFSIGAKGNRIIRSSVKIQGAKKVSFTACHSGKRQLACTSPQVIQLAPKPFLISRIDYNPSVIWISQKNFTCPSGKLRTYISSPIAKPTSPKRSDTTFFARWNILILACERSNLCNGHF